MTHALLGCTIVLTLALTAHAQGFDPLYKPKPGDEAIIGRLQTYNPTDVFGLQPKLVFFGELGFEFPEMIRDLNRVTGHMEDGHTYMFKQGKQYYLHAGLKVKIIAKTRTRTTLYRAMIFTQMLKEPIYEVEIAEGEFTGTHVYTSGISLQQKANHLQYDWDYNTNTVAGLAMHAGLVLEDDNPKFAITQYQDAYSFSSDTNIVAAAKSKLIEAGVPLPKTRAETIAENRRFRRFAAETKDEPKDDAEPKTSGFGKPLAAPKEDAAEALTVDLLDTTWEHSSSGSYIYIYVKVRNTSGTTLNRLKVTATLEQQDNSIVSTEYSYLEPTVIDPSGVALAKLMIRANPLIHHYNLTFETKGREVKFKNRTR